MSDTRAIGSIIVSGRHRRDLGDIASLARSIAELGLLHPLPIRPDGVLIAGERRLRAVQQLGWTEVPVRVVPIDEIIRGELAENAERKDFLPSEIEAIRRAMAATVATPHGGDRSKVETFHLDGRTPGKTRDKIGAFAGISGRQVEKIAKVVEAAEAEPERYANLQADMAVGPQQVVLG